ncbi:MULTISPECIES: putative nucleotidyltransferase substrate binding domain-containing protein [unclassified Thioalkalivibrio]|uniref:putative nucleotidyltransferase substrate binding domain-containing protein n=1 Tax=unclassified Thioalkalivibrio TaxID=2621013 RepID=UPI000381A4BD|nr:MULTISPECIES: putative nucleotidyltransferase substrate binding domain-containing protein [unclassified Thioalkalivibrio]
MNGELEEIREFLERCPELARLSSETRTGLVRRLTLRYLREDSPFPPRDAEPGELWIVRTGAAELYDMQDQLQDRLGEGDLLNTTRVADLRGRITEDALIYQLAAERARDLADRDEAFHEFLETDSDRLRAQTMTWPGGERSLLTTPVRALMTPRPIMSPTSITLCEAAQRMTEADISALLLHEPGREDVPVGILTDTDLRHALAEGTDPGCSVARCMAQPVASVSRDTPAFDALLRMARRDIHHLPVTDGDDGPLVGILSSTDLIRHQGTSAVYLVRDLRRADDLDALRDVMRALPSLQVQLVEAGADATQIGQTITTVIDTLTQCLIELAEAKLGPAPAAYAWLASGSQGRHEQTVHTDQDTALVYDDMAPPEADAWFQRLADEVGEGLAACGIPRCPGEVDPSQPQWRRTTSDWERELRRVLSHPSPRDAMLASHYLDLRVIHGPTSLFEPMRHEALEQGYRSEAVLTTLADQARDLRPPLGFFRQFVLERGGEHGDTLDLKMRGLMPIVALARVFALRAGSDARGTVERLRAARHAGILSANTGADLIDAWQFIATLRARHQADQIGRGIVPDNALAPSDLSGLERSHLKNVFRLVAHAQKASLAQTEQVHG